MGNPGSCQTCTICKPGDVEVTPCDDISDTVCSSGTDCRQFGVTCPQGSYHAGCDPLIGERGWCERCPIQDKTECGEDFFLNFECRYGEGDFTDKLSLVPNECLPCNQFKCAGVAEQFPMADDCGREGLGFERTKLAKEIVCTGTCKRPNGLQWIDRECQFSIAEPTTYGDFGV